MWFILYEDAGKFITKRYDLSISHEHTHIVIPVLNGNGKWLSVDI